MKMGVENCKSDFLQKTETSIHDSVHNITC